MLLLEEQSENTSSSSSIFYYPISISIQSQVSGKYDLVAFLVLDLDMTIPLACIRPGAPGPPGWLLQDLMLLLHINSARRWKEESR